MREKNGLDRNAFSNFYNDDNNFKESEDRKKIRQKVIKFNKNAPKCENFMLEEGEIRCKIYWCKVINKFCSFYNCPKNNNKSVNN